MILALAAISLFWYAIATQSPFEELTNVLNHIYLEISALTPAPGVVGLMPRYFSGLHEISKYLFYAIQGLIVLGLGYILTRSKKGRFNQEYLTISVFSMIILILSITIPTFASALNMSRFYHIALFFLAPFSVLGCLAASRLLTRFVNKLSLASIFRFKVLLNGKKCSLKRPLIFIFVVLIVLLFLFQVGFLYEIANDPVPSSLPLSLHRLSDNPLVNMDLWGTHSPQKDVWGVNWFSKQTGSQSNIYADCLSRQGVLTSYGKIPLEFQNYPQVYNYNHMLLKSGAPVDNGAYVFLSQLNTNFGVIIIPNEGYWSYNSSYLEGFDKIYSNSGSDIYLKP